MAELRLDGEAPEVVRAEVQALLAALCDEERRARLADLLAAVEDGAVSDAEVDDLAEVLELALQTGRIRSLYGPQAEADVLTVYRRLPAGRDLQAAASEVTEALAPLEGRQLERVEVRATGPAAHTITIAADGLELSVRLDRSGARVASVVL